MPDNVPSEERRSAHEKNGSDSIELAKTHSKESSIADLDTSKSEGNVSPVLQQMSPGEVSQLSSDTTTLNSSSSTTSDDEARRVRPHNHRRSSLSINAIKEFGSTKIRFTEELRKTFAPSALNAYILFGGVLLVIGGALFAATADGIIVDSLSPGQVSGSFIGMLSCGAVIVTYKRYPTMQQHPAPLLYYKSWADLGLSVRLFAIACLRTDENLRPYFTEDEHSCTFAGGVCQFFILASELWLLCIVLDIRKSIKNPFANFKSQLKRYHHICWGISLASAIIMWFTPGAAGVSDLTLCWTNRDAKIYGPDDNSFFNINYASTLFFFLWVFFINAFALLTLVEIYQLLRGATMVPSPPPPNPRLNHPSHLLWARPSLSLTSFPRPTRTTW
jgi:hypothetical protein